MGILVESVSPVTGVRPGNLAVTRGHLLLPGGQNALQCGSSANATSDQKKPTQPGRPLDRMFRVVVYRVMVSGFSAKETALPGFSARRCFVTGARLAAEGAAAGSSGAVSASFTSVIGTLVGENQMLG